MTPTPRRAIPRVTGRDAPHGHHDTRQGRAHPRTLPNANDTGFNLVGDVIRDILEQDRDSHRYDRQLLKQMNGLRTARKLGVDALTFHGDRLPEDSPLTADQRVSESAACLERDTPSGRRARVMGKLDMTRNSDGTFAMLLNSGETVHGVWLPDHADVLAEHWRQLVVVEGQAVFRPSGSLLRLEAEGMARATEADGFFSAMPQSQVVVPDGRPVGHVQTRRSGVGALFGRWLGDETEEEILAALKAMRQ